MNAKAAQRLLLYTVVQSDDDPRRLGTVIEILPDALMIRWNTLGAGPTRHQFNTLRHVSLYEPRYLVFQEFGQERAYLWIDPNGRTEFTDQPDQAKLFTYKQAAVFAIKDYFVKKRQGVREPRRLGIMPA